MVEKEEEGSRFDDPGAWKDIYLAFCWGGRSRVEPSSLSLGTCAGYCFRCERIGNSCHQTLWILGITNDCLIVIRIVPAPRK